MFDVIEGGGWDPVPSSPDGYSRLCDALEAVPGADEFGCGCWSAYGQDFELVGVSFSDVAAIEMARRLHLSLRSWSDSDDSGGYLARSLDVDICVDAEWIGSPGAVEVALSLLDSWGLLRGC